MKVKFIVIVTTIFVAANLIIINNHQLAAGSYFFANQQKYTFNEKLKVKQTNNHKYIVDHEQQINLDSTPIYNENNQSIVFAEDSILMLFEDGIKFYQVPAFSEIYKIKQDSYLKTNHQSKKLPNFVIYTTDETYLFGNTVDINACEASYRLSPLSYVNNSKDEIEVYEYQSNEFYQIKNEKDCRVNVELSDNVTLDLEQQKIKINQETIALNIKPEQMELYI